MNDSSTPLRPEALKCSECGAKITQAALQPGSPIICEYCGAIIMLPHSKPKPAHTSRRLHQRLTTRRQLRRAPILYAVKLLIEKDAIDEKTLRQYTKRNIDQKMRPPMALRRALRQMRDDGKIKRDTVMSVVDELIAEHKLPPHSRENFQRLFS